LRSIQSINSSAVRGGVWALLAATCFGLSTPFIQRYGAGVGAFTTAALLYAGAAGLALLLRQSSEQEAPLVKQDIPRLLGMAVMGAAIGPVALAWGLQHTSGASASLMLTLEALFTVVLAWLWYGEVMDKRVATASGLLLLGGVVLVLEQGLQGQVQLLGVLAVGLATLAWGVDNALSRGVAERDPAQVVIVKSVLGSVITLVFAVARSEPIPTMGVMFILLAIGATGYGLSLRFYLLAQRQFGASRTGSVFAFAPFIGGVAAFAMGDRLGTWLMLGAGLLMLAGVALHLMESHTHEHSHDVLTHEHAHSHDDRHHDHLDDRPHIGVASNQAHSHAHTHQALKHSHAHTPDAHHLHTHA
jgi:drug/metabolite transporter (DMT)-like permease